MWVMKITAQQRAMISRAREFAVMAHDGQFRADGITPFKVHPEFVSMAVAGRVSAAGEAAAHLHDVKEDTKYQDLSEFPLRVRQLVDLLTRRSDETKPEMIQRVGDSGDAEGIMIKVADRIHNLSDGGKEFGARWFVKYLMGARRILEIAVDNGLGAFDLPQMLKGRIEELEEELNNES